MIIGVPKEIKVHEYRVGMVPASVSEAVAHGHKVYVETLAGSGIGFSDQDYIDAGAQILPTATDVFAEAEMIVKVKEDLYFNADAVKDLQKRLVDFIKTHGEISTPQFKEMTGVSRKYLIPLIEYFDAQNVTIRIGDIRKLRNR